LALLLLSVSSTEPEEVTALQVVPPPEAPQELSVFLENVYRHFGLDTPNQILACFDDRSAKLFCKALCATGKILEDSRDRKNFASHMDFLKLQCINEELEPIYGCIMMTQDFTDLLDKLDIGERNPIFFAMSIYLYYQALYPRLADDIQPLITAAKQKDWTTAGDLFGALFEVLVGEIKADGFGYLAFSGFSNGAAHELGLPFPSDSIQCHNDDSAIAILKFLYKLSIKVQQGGIKEVPLSVLNFWNDEGKAILDTIPQDVIDCNLNSQDIAALSQRLGIRVGSKGFGEALKRFITKRRITFYAAMKAIRGAFEDHNFVHAGWTWGHMLDEFSRSLPASEEETPKVIDT